MEVKSCLARVPIFPIDTLVGVLYEDTSYLSTHTIEKMTKIRVKIVGDGDINNDLDEGLDVEVVEKYIREKYLFVQGTGVIQGLASGVLNNTQLFEFTNGMKINPGTVHMSIGCCLILFYLSVLFSSI